MNISVRVVFNTAKDILMNIAIWTNVVERVLDARRSGILDLDTEDILCTAILLKCPYL